MNRTIPLLLLIAGVMAGSCARSQHGDSNRQDTTTHHSQELFLKAMQTHLDAVSNRDLIALKSTLSPDGTLLFILPNREITTTAADFIQYHKEWFKDTAWTLETEILDTHIGEKTGIAIAEIIYREPERDGKPYFNRMTVSYALKKIEGRWYVFKDHASSAETSAN